MSCFGLARSGMTMLIVSHEMGFASAAADRVVFMDGGEIIEIDTPDNLFNTPSPRAPSNSSTTSSSDGKDAP